MEINYNLGDGQLLVKVTKMKEAKISDTCLVLPNVKLKEKGQDGALSVEEVESSMYREIVAVSKDLEDREPLIGQRVILKEGWKGLPFDAQYYTKGLDKTKYELIEPRMIGLTIKYPENFYNESEEPEKKETKA